MKKFLIRILVIFSLITLFYGVVTTDGDEVFQVEAYLHGNFKVFPHKPRMSHMPLS